MLDVHFVILGAVIDGIGAAVYLRDTIRGVTQPNRVSWLLWGIAPLLAFAVEIQARVGLRSLMTFVIGFFPLVIFVASFVNPKAVWKLRLSDYFCGGLAVIGLIVWLVSRHGTIALFAFIAADAIAGIPTFRKSWSQPETETATAYVLASVNAAITLLTVNEVSTAVLAFPVWIFVVASLDAIVIVSRIGPRLRARQPALATDICET